MRKTTQAVSTIFVFLSVSWTPLVYGAGNSGGTGGGKDLTPLQRCALGFASALALTDNRLGAKGNRSRTVGAEGLTAALTGKLKPVHPQGTPAERVAETEGSNPDITIAEPPTSVGTPAGEGLKGVMESTANTPRTTSGPESLFDSALSQVQVGRGGRPAVLSRGGMETPTTTRREGNGLGLTNVDVRDSALADPTLASARTVRPGSGEITVDATTGTSSRGRRPTSVPGEGFDALTEEGTIAPNDLIREQASARAARDARLAEIRAEEAPAASRVGGRLSPVKGPLTDRVEAGRPNWQTRSEAEIGLAEDISPEARDAVLGIEAPVEKGPGFLGWIKNELTRKRYFPGQRERAEARAARREAGPTAEPSAEPTKALVVAEAPTRSRSGDRLTPVETGLSGRINSRSAGRAEEAEMRLAEGLSDAGRDAALGIEQEDNSGPVTLVRRPTPREVPTRSRVGGPISEVRSPLGERVEARRPNWQTKSEAEFGLGQDLTDQAREELLAGDPPAPQTPGFFRNLYNRVMRRGTPSPAATVAETTPTAPAVAVAEPVATPKPYTSGRLTPVEEAQGLRAQIAARKAARGEGELRLGEDLTPEASDVVFGHEPVVATNPATPTAPVESGWRKAWNFLNSPITLPKFSRTSAPANQTTEATTAPVENAAATAPRVVSASIPSPTKVENTQPLIPGIVAADSGPGLISRLGGLLGGLRRGATRNVVDTNKNNLANADTQVATQNGSGTPITVVAAPLAKVEAPAIAPTIPVVVDSFGSRGASAGTGPLNEGGTTERLVDRAGLGSTIDTGGTLRPIVERSPTTSLTDGLVGGITATGFELPMGVLGAKRTQTGKPSETLAKTEGGDGKADSVDKTAPDITFIEEAGKTERPVDVTLVTPPTTTVGKAEVDKGSDVQQGDAVIVSEAVNAPSTETKVEDPTKVTSTDKAPGEVTAVVEAPASEEVRPPSEGQASSNAQTTASEGWGIKKFLNWAKGLGNSNTTTEAKAPVVEATPSRVGGRLTEVRPPLAARVETLRPNWQTKSETEIAIGEDATPAARDVVLGIEPVEPAQPKRPWIGRRIWNRLTRRVVTPAPSATEASPTSVVATEEAPAETKPYRNEGALEQIVEPEGLSARMAARRAKRAGEESDSVALAEGMTPEMMDSLLSTEPAVAKAAAPAKKPSKVWKTLNTPISELWGNFWTRGTPSRATEETAPAVAPTERAPEPQVVANLGEAKTELAPTPRIVRRVLTARTDRSVDGLGRVKKPKTPRPKKSAADPSKTEVAKVEEPTKGEELRDEVADPTKIDDTVAERTDEERAAAADLSLGDEGIGRNSIGAPPAPTLVPARVEASAGTTEPYQYFWTRGFNWMKNALARKPPAASTSQPVVAPVGNPVVTQVAPQTTTPSGSPAPQRVTLGQRWKNFRQARTSNSDPRWGSAPPARPDPNSPTPPTPVVRGRRRVPAPVQTAVAPTQVDPNAAPVQAPYDPGAPFQITVDQNIPLPGAGTTTQAQPTQQAGGQQGVYRGTPVTYPPANAGGGRRGNRPPTATTASATPDPAPSQRGWLRRLATLPITFNKAKYAKIRAEQEAKFLKKRKDKADAKLAKARRKAEKKARWARRWQTTKTVAKVGTVGTAVLALAGAGALAVMGLPQNTTTEDIATPGGFSLGPNSTVLYLKKKNGDTVTECWISDGQMTTRKVSGDGRVLENRSRKVPNTLPAEEVERTLASDDRFVEKANTSGYGSREAYMVRYRDGEYDDEVPLIRPGFNSNEFNDGPGAKRIIDYLNAHCQ